AAARIPMLAHLSEIAADTTGGDDHGLGLNGEIGRAVLTRAADDVPAVRLELLDVVMEMRLQPRRLHMRAQGRDDLRYDALASAPAQMKARHRVARHLEPALDPQNHGQPAEALRS